MREPEPGELDLWVKCWTTAASFLRQERRARLREMETPTEIAKLGGGEVAVRLWKRPDNGLGLVEQQRVFARWAR